MARRTILATMLGGFLIATVGPTPVGATGYWNLPSTFCQCTGCGWGAGHHAPLLLGPASHHGWLAHNNRRLPYPPSPPYTWHCGPHCEPPFHAPTILEPAPAPAAPLPEPITRRHRPLFLR